MKSRSATAFAFGLILAVATAWCATVWSDGFESYTVGQLPPNPPWAPSGNTSSCYVDGSVSYEGTKSLHLYGVVGGSWGAHQHHLIGTSAPYQIEYMVRTGDEVIPPYGHYAYSDLELRTGPSWTYPGRSLLSFRKDGWICGVPGPLRQFNKLQWYHCSVLYERPNASTVTITYKIDDDVFGPYDTPAFSFEDDLTWMSLIANAGTAWYDAVSITTPGVNPEPTLLAVPYYQQERTPWCLPTSVSMVLGYYGINRKPVWVAKDLRLDNTLTGENKKRTGEALRSGVQDYLRTYQHLSEQWWWREDGLISRSFSECSTYVDDQVRAYKRPVLLAVSLNDGNGHAVVVMGVSNESLYVNDPSGFLLRDLWNMSNQQSTGYSDWELSPVAHGIAWHDFEEFYVVQDWVATITDLASIPASPSAASLDVLPGGVYFRRENGDQLDLKWIGYHGKSWFPYGYAPLSPRHLFPHDKDFGRSATSACQMYVTGNFGNSELSPLKVKVVLQVIEESSGRVACHGEREYRGGEDPPLPARDWSERYIMSAFPQKIVDPFPLQNLTGRYWLSLRLLDLESSALLDTCAVYFNVTPEPKDGGQGYSVVELTDGCDQPQLALNTVGRATLLTYSIPKQANVSIVVRDVAGRAVRTLVDAAQSTGQHRLTWDGKDDGGRTLPSGSYFCTMNSGDFTATRKMVKTE